MCDRLLVSSIVALASSQELGEVTLLEHELKEVDWRPGNASPVAVCTSDAPDSLCLPVSMTFHRFSETYNTESLTHKPRHKARPSLMTMLEW